MYRDEKGKMILTKDDKLALKAFGIALLGMLSVASIIKQFFIGFSWTYTFVSILLATIGIVILKKNKED